jgi:sulfur transfer protein SufE
MDRHFPMTRANGLKAMLKQIKIYAMAFKQKPALYRA